ncbi:methyl-accepting chemotaxis protein [Lacrimispora brassicae]
MEKKGIKQSTLNFLLGGSAIFLSVILVILAIQVMSSFLGMRAAEERKAEFKQLGIDLANASDYLTNEARAYVQFGDKVHYDNYWREVNETKTRDKVVERLNELGAPQNELDLLAEAKKSSDTLVETEDKAMKAVEKGDFEEARHLMFDAQYDSDKRVIMAPISKFQETMNARASGEMNQAVSKTQTYIIVMILLMVFTAVFNGISLLLSHVKIIKPIIKLKDDMITAAEGDLSQSVSVAADNTEIGQLAMASATAIETVRNIIQEISRILTEMSKGNLAVEIKGDYRGDYTAIKTSLNQIIQSFNEVLGDVRTAADQVASGSNQVSGSSISLSQGATEQASSVEQLTASIEEIAAQTRQSAGFAGQANELADAAKRNAEHGNEQMRGMLQAMEEINDSSANISRIIKVIDEIAFQTNILALNAAVEAARAGEYGKGFAVVADEVRSLAVRSADAAKETTDMIGNSIKKVEGGTRIAKETAGALIKIVEDVEKVASLIGDIAIASNNQAEGIAQINLGVMQVSQVIQTNSATSEESAAASEELAGQAEMLKDQVSRFRLKSGGRI